MKIQIKLAIFVILSAMVACNHGKVSTDAQTTKTDSLLVAFRQEVQTDPENTMPRIRKARQSAEDSLAYYRLNELLAIGYFMGSKNDSAFAYGKEVIRFCEAQKQDYPGINKFAILAYNDMGVFFKIAGQQDSAIVYMEKAADAAGKSGEKKNQLDIYVNLAGSYNQKSDFPSAVRYYRKALLIADSLNMENEAPSIHAGLAHAYTDMKNYKEADYYFKKAENMFDCLSDNDKHFLNNTRGNYYFAMREYEKALPWIRKANATAKIYGLQNAIATTEANLGEIFLFLNRPDSAKYYLDKSAPYFLSNEASPAAKFYLKGLYASYYLEMNDLHQAQTYLSQPYDTALINPLYLYYHNKRLENLYEKRGDYKKAYDLSLITRIYDDSTRNIAMQNNIAEIDSRYRQDTIVLKRDIQLALKEQKLVEAQRTNIFVISLFIIAALCVAGITVYKRKKRELQQMRQISVITNLRMENIRNRVSPHFMFNVLNSVIPNLREHENLARPMQLLIESIRGSLAASEKLAVTLEEEIKIVQNYLALVESVQSDVPEISWEISPDVDLNTLVPSMILQIPVENAIKYAFGEEKEGQLLVINIFTKDSTLNLEVRDNGIGIDRGRTSSSTKGTGTGLNILYKTIEMLNVMNHKKMEFEIKNEVNISADKNGTKVSIKIPSDYKYEL